MKKVYFTILILSIAGIIFFISCKKEYSCEDCAEKNKPPIAIAGLDQVITLPTDSVLLDGRSSSDPDGKISEWLWKKISGPASFNIIRQSDSITKVKALIKGIYQFELKVTDNARLSAKDTVQIIVNDPSQPNRPPVANAGADQTITLPSNNVTVDGSGSTDPDNNIIRYVWTKISGPSSFSIVSANIVQTQIANLIEGVYQFELKVTDAGGLFSKDTTQIIINDQTPAECDNSSNRSLVNAQLIPVATLSQARGGMSVASSGNKILFAGGGTNALRSTRVDIYDINTNISLTAELCVARHGMATVASGNKIFFGGGEYSDGTWPVDSVDIYDVTSNTWTVAHLSSAGNGIAAASVGNKVFFAGGDPGFNGTPGVDRSRQVDIYNLSTNTWSTAQLSDIKRGGLTAVAANNKVYFAGGEGWTNNPGGNNTHFASNKIDIYDNNTDSWSTSLMIEGKIAFSGIAVADKIYWAGGATGSSPTFHNSCLVEIKDINTGSSSTQYLFKPGIWWIGSGQNAVVRNNKLIFMRYYEPLPAPTKFDIYDITTNTWSIGVLPVNVSYAAIISVNNVIYVAGGTVNGLLSDKVWKLEF